jgi:hypothetical protein
MTEGTEPFEREHEPEQPPEEPQPERDKPMIETEEEEKKEEDGGDGPEETPQEELHAMEGDDPDANQ